MKTLQTRFEEKFIPEPNTGCWLWVACLMRGGYGGFWDGARTRRAHRVAYELFVGPIQGGLCVCHRCDIPNCVNPDHLFLGTKTDNMADCVSKGRQSSGDKNGRAKLTDEKVLAIRADVDRPGRSLAAEHGVSQALVSLIRSRQLWTHL